jgi:hypothetical protein
MDAEDAINTIRSSQQKWKSKRTELVAFVVVEACAEHRKHRLRRQKYPGSFAR